MLNFRISTEISATMTQSCNNNHININTSTIPKNIMLNWLYSTDRHVSIEKLGAWIENNTEGQYKLIKTGNKAPMVQNTQLNKECA